MPQMYMHWFNKYSPCYIKIPGSAPFLQYLKFMQGMKPAGQDFYKIIKSIFNHIGIDHTSIDYGFHVLIYKDKKSGDLYHCDQ